MKIYSRTALSTPPSEIRLNPHNSWEEFAMNHKAILQVYQLVVTEQLLSHEESISIDKLKDLLKYSYYIPSNVVTSFMNFITNTDTIHIEWEEPQEGVRTNRIFARPRRMKPSVVGIYSLWIPRQEP